MLGLDAERYVSRHNAAGNVRHSGGHNRHQLRARALGQERTDGKWSFGLSHEDRSCYVQRLHSAYLHGAFHQPGKEADDELHNAEVVQQSKER